MQRMLAEEVPLDKPVWAHITTPVVDWRLAHDSAIWAAADAKPAAVPIRISDIM
jgi:hypothetical protein